MLDPQDRILLTEALRPPDGFELSWAIGTSFTLDLVAAMAAPLAFALFDWQEEGAAGADPIPLLEALRRYADKLTIFVQEGGIVVPRPQQILLSYLDDSVVECRAPAPGALFHPKVWLLRFSHPDQPTRYRFACLSRNLTFDRAWDTALVIEGSVGGRRHHGFNRPLVDFVAALPKMARRRPISAELKSRMKQAQQEVARVTWDLPRGIEELAFLPLGIDSYRTWPLSGRIDRLMVISPFLGAGAVARMGRDGRGDVLVSRLESLRELETMKPFERIFVMNDGVELRLGDDDSEDVGNVLRGLHAKLYVADAGWKARIWTGSANATDAAFGSNVEFMVELLGSKSVLGIDALLSTGSGEARFGDLLTPYEDHEWEAPDELEEKLRAEIEKARRALAGAALMLRVRPEGEGGIFPADLLAGPRPLKLTSRVTVRCWPIMLGEGASAALQQGPSEQLAHFEIGGQELSSLVAFSVEAKEGSAAREERFVLNVLLDGAPDDRRQRVLRGIIQDRDRLLRFLLFLLADGDPGQLAAVLLPSARSNGDSDATDSYVLDLPLFESMLRALDRNPRKLDHVRRVIEDLRRTPEGEALIPQGFSEIWEPIWAAREALG